MTQTTKHLIKADKENALPTKCGGFQLQAAVGDPSKFI